MRRKLKTKSGNLHVYFCRIRWENPRHIPCVRVFVSPLKGAQLEEEQHRGWVRRLHGNGLFSFAQQQSPLAGPFPERSTEGKKPIGAFFSDARLSKKGSLTRKHPTSILVGSLLGASLEAARGLKAKGKIEKWIFVQKEPLWY